MICMYGYYSGATETTFSYPIHQHLLAIALVKR